MSKLVSNTLKTAERDKAERPVYKLMTEEKAQQSIWHDRMEKAWRELTTACDEFDGLSLIETMKQNRLARNSFLTPILNDGEVRVVTGTTEGKVDSIFHAATNQNIELEIRAFNEFDIEDVMLGDGLTKLVKRTGQMENEEDVEAEAFDEILTCPMVFIQDTMSDEWYYDRVLKAGQWDDLWQGKIPTFENRGWARCREPKKVIWTADQVLLANYKIPARMFQLQPYIILHRIRPLNEAEGVYRHAANWKFVRGGMPAKQEYRGQVESSEWRFSKQIKNDEVEEIIALSVPDDEQQIWLNGVPMLPVGCPYLGNRFGRYNMTMEIFKPIHRKFGPGRPPVSMVKTLQALKDESFRLAILHYRQQIFQPIVTKAQSILSKDMWLPASITYGVDKSEIESLIDKPGMAVDQALQDMIEKEIEKFVNVSPLFQGQDPGGSITATQAAQQMKQALIMLGHALVARLRMKRNCGYLRLFTILQNMLDPIDTRWNSYLKKEEDVYRTYSLRDADLNDGAVGTEIISFINRQLTAEEVDKILDNEKESRTIGKPKSYSFISIDKLKKVPYQFYINTIATEKRNSLIEKEMFKADIIDSINLANTVGVQVNPDYVTQEWAKRVKIDAKKLYVIPMAPLGMGVMPNEADGEMPAGKNEKMGMKQMMAAGAGSMSQ